jgi:hypothetical protein
MKTFPLNRLLFLLSYVILACAFVWYTQPTYLVSIIVVLCPPTALTYSWVKRSRAKILAFSLATTFLFAPPIELVSRMANAWDVQSILPRPLGLIPLENMFFAFLNFFWVLSFYEYFVDGDQSKKISKRFRSLIIIYSLLFIGVFWLYFLAPGLIPLNYAFMAVPVLVFPGIIIFTRKPGLLRKTLIPTVFFFFVLLLYELVSLCIGSWWWPGEYVYPMTVFGKVFPLDDIIIWYILSTPVLIGGYEYFMDDDH